MEPWGDGPSDPSQGTASPWPCPQRDRILWWSLAGDIPSQSEAGPWRRMLWGLQPADGGEPQALKRRAEAPQLLGLRRCLVSRPWHGFLVLVARPAANPPGPKDKQGEDAEGGVLSGARPRECADAAARRPPPPLIAQPLSLHGNVLSAAPGLCNLIAASSATSAWCAAAELHRQRRALPGNAMPYRAMTCPTGQ